jgi:hypothetical protein
LVGKKADLALLAADQRRWVTKYVYDLSQTALFGDETGKRGLDTAL